MSSARFEFRGDLALTPLPEVLETIHGYKVPGVLSAMKDGVEKKIFISHGDVIFATSGDRHDSLGDYMLRTARISQEQFDASVEALIFSGGKKRHGEVMVDMGILTSGELYSIVQQQVRGILFSIFDWEHGEFLFEVGQYRTDELIQLEIPARQAILEGIKHVKDAPRLVKLLGPSWTVFDPCWKPEDLTNVGLASGEMKLLQYVDGLKTLKDLVVLGPGDPAYNAKLMYAFFVLRLISRRELTSRSIKKIHMKTLGGTYAQDDETPTEG